MRIAKLSLICLIAFVFMVGCGMLGKKAEMSETAATDTAATGETVIESQAQDDMAGDMEQAAVEEVTLNVTGMT